MAKSRNRSPYSTISSCLIALCLGLHGAEIRGQESLPDELQQRCAAICQPEDAPWRSVPWQTDLLKAQHLAVEQGKPIFIWAMDGHPLGCT